MASTFAPADASAVCTLSAEWAMSFHDRSRKTLIGPPVTDDGSTAERYLK